MMLFTGWLLPELSLAQCTPGNHTMAGFYPTTQAGIHPAAADAPWALNMTVVTPKDTVISPFPRVNIDSAKIQGFIGFPPSFSVSYSTASTWFSGNSTECLLIQGTPTSADIGVHNISLIFTAMILNIPYTDTIFDYWQFEVKDATHTGIGRSEADDTGLKIYPVPSREKLTMEADQEVALMGVYNSHGQLVMDFNEKIMPLESFSLSVSQLPAGVYYARFTSGEGVVSRRFVVMR